MNAREIEEALRGFVRDSYPAMDIRAEAWSEDRSRLAIYFTEEKFALIYPQQRFHYLSHLIPRKFQESELSHSVWFELAPGETPDDLVYPDQELIADITQPGHGDSRKNRLLRRPGRSLHGER